MPGRLGLGLIELLLAMALLGVGASMFANVMLSRTALRASEGQRVLAAEAARTAIERMVSEELGEVFERYNLDPADDPDGPGTAPGGRFKVDSLVPLPDALDGCVGTIIFPALHEVASTEKESEGEKTLREAREKEQEERKQRQNERVSQRDKLQEALDREARKQRDREMKEWLASLSAADRKSAETDLAALEKAEREQAKQEEKALEAAEEEALTEAKRLEEEAAKLRAIQEKEPYWQLREDVNLPLLGMPRDLNGDGIITPRDRSEDYAVLPVEILLEWQGQSGPASLRLHTILAAYDMGER